MKKLVRRNSVNDNGVQAYGCWCGLACELASCGDAFWLTADLLENGRHNEAVSSYNSKYKK